MITLSDVILVTFPDVDSEAKRNAMRSQICTDAVTNFAAALRVNHI